MAMLTNQNSPWYDQEMDWSLRSNIIECHALVILMNELGRNGTIQDLIKDGGTLRSACLSLLSLTHIYYCLMSAIHYSYIYIVC